MRDLATSWKSNLRIQRKREITSWLNWGTKNKQEIIQNKRKIMRERESTKSRNKTNISEMIGKRKGFYLFRYNSRFLEHVWSWKMTGTDREVHRINWGKYGFNYSKFFVRLCRRWLERRIWIFNNQSRFD